MGKVGIYRREGKTLPEGWTFEQGAAFRIVAAREAVHEQEQRDHAQDVARTPATARSLAAASPGASRDSTQPLKARSSA